jgi:hypothetical protein
MHWSKFPEFHKTGLMIIHNFNFVRIFALPTEADAPLVVDPNAKLPGAAALKGFQPISGRQPQVAQIAGTRQLRQFSQGHPFNLRRQTMVALTLPQTLSLPAGETGNHRFNLS